MTSRLRWLLFVWALPTAGTTAMLWLVMISLLESSTDVLGVGPAVVGALFGLGRLWDAVSNPAVGFLSDRTRSRLGRRRPWIAALWIAAAQGSAEPELNPGPRAARRLPAAPPARG